MAPVYCPVCARYSDKYPTQDKMEDHLISIHPISPEAIAVQQKRRKGYANDLASTKTTQQ